jgi:isopentenyl diphosphate isomerase/L-lactate dehydrogenase-like FMN-dependent dehydrogenase
MKLFGKIPVTFDRRPPLERVFSLDTLRELARRKTPAMVFDFIDGGAEDEVTLGRNFEAFTQVRLKPRALVDVSKKDTSVTVLGQEIPSPLILGPAGLAGVAWPGGEAVAARAANARGLPFVLSTAGSASIEEVADVASGPLWFQLYLWRDRDVTKALVERAKVAGYDVLCLTVDVPQSGQRERDLRHGWTIPPNVTLRNAYEVATHPGWARRVMLGPEVTFRNFLDMDLKKDYVSLGQIVNAQLNPSGTWDDMSWLRDMWPGKLILKGILTAEDATLAADRGADGVVVSNHGGRQLDGVAGALEALPEVVAAVGDRCEVLLDGGVRRGTDVIKALSLGAKACMFARPYMYGLAAGGEAGVLRTIDILNAEILRAMTLVGCPNLAEVSPENSFIVGSGIDVSPGNLSINSI